MTSSPNPGSPTTKSNSIIESSDTDTLFTGSDYERNRENLRSANPQGQTQPSRGVDVEKAEEEFAALSKQLSGVSQNARRTSNRASTGLDEKGVNADVEDVASEDAPFDLEATLRGSRDADTDAGIKPKRIGALILEYQTMLSFFLSFVSCFRR